MNPFVALHTDSKPTAWGWLAARPGLIAFVLTLALGFAAVGWRANSRAKAAREFARLEAQARGASVQAQLRHAVAALQILGALARQSGGSIPSFQTVGADLRAAWPDLATLELEPNGVAGDIAPRAGYERFIGFNVLKDAAQFPSAQAAIQRRAATVAGPLKLYRGEPGIVVRAPVFLRGRDGRDFFWGFVAASLRLTEPLARVRTDELQQAVQQEFGAQALKPSPAPAQLGGWLQESKTPLECLGVLFLAGLLWLLMHLVQSGHTLEAALADANRRLASLGVERGQAQQDWRSAKEAAASAQAQLKEARAALQRAESESLERQARLEESQRANRETTQALDARLKQAELNAQQLQAQLDAAVRAADAAARAAEAELEETRGALHQARETIGHLQSHPATQAESGALAPAALVELPATEAAPALEENPPPPITPITPISPISPIDPIPPAAASPEDPPAPPLPPAPAEPSGPPPQKRKARPKARRRETRRDLELDLFASPVSSTRGLDETGGEAPDSAEPKGVESALPPTAQPEEEPGTATNTTDRRSPKPASRLADVKRPVNPVQLRKAVSQILPLLAGRDPGAKDCLADNRLVFQAAFAPEAYSQFKQSIQQRDFDSAQEQLKKAVKKHGII